MGRTHYKIDEFILKKPVRYCGANAPKFQRVFSLVILKGLNHKGTADGL